MSHIDKLRYQTLDLVPKNNDAAHKLVESMFTALKELNQTNIAALLPMRSIDLHSRQLDLSELVFGEDYEVGSTFRTDDEEFETYDAITEAIDAQETMIEQLEGDETSEQNTIDELEGEIEAIEHEKTDGVRDEKKLAKLQKKLAKAKADHAKVETKLEEAKERLEALEKARDEPEYDEIMWNTAWRPDGDDIDEDLAHRLPNLGVIRLLKEDQTYISLTGCGMDLTPCVMAYCVLKTGMIDPEHAHYFTRDQDIDYALHVIGRKLMLECAEKMEVKEAFELKLAQIETDRAASRKAEKLKQRRIDKIKRTRPSARLLDHVLALRAENLSRPEGERESYLSISDLQAFIARQMSDLLGQKERKAELKQLDRDMTELKRYREAFFFSHTGLDDLVNAGLPKPKED